MSDSNINTSGVKLNAAASEFVPGNYGAKPAATKAPVAGKAAPAGKSMPYNNSRPQNNRNAGFNNPGMMQQQPQYAPPPVHVDFAVQQYIAQMQQMAAYNGMMYDPVSNMMYVMHNGGLMPVMVPGMPAGMIPGMAIMPVQYGAAAFAPGDAGVEGTEGFETATEGQPAEAPVTETVAPAEVPAAEEAVAVPAPVVAAAPAAAPAKYVPPTRSTAESAPAPAPAAVPAAAVQEAAAKLSVLSIDTEPEAPVDIEAASPGRVLRYSKNVILGLYHGQGVVIPAELKDFFKAADYAAGSVDGSTYCRAPLASIASLSDSAFGGGRDTPGSRGKGSSNNLRHSQSGNNLERSTSTSSFGNARHEGGNNNNNNRRKGGNRDADKDREPGEIVEGDDGFVAFEGGEEAGAPRERTSRRAKVPAVYKSRFALDASDPMAIVRKANSILNKMSVTNFDKLSDEFLALLQSDAKTEESLQKSVEALVTKAQMEENFCFIYADLCRKIIDNWTELEPEDGNFTPAQGATEEAPAEAPAEGEEVPAKKVVELRPMGKVFRSSLLSRCQAEFEFDQVKALQEIRENAELAPDERIEKEVLLKKRTTGHMRFIGELYMKELISAGTMKESCLEVLLKSEKEEELVCLCKLFQTVGAKMEKYHIDRSKQKKYKAQNLQEVFPAYFEQVAVIGTKHPSSRVRFMMKDLVEMRANDWTARREEDKMISLEKKTNPADFAPVQTAYVSGDARNAGDAFAAAPVDEWSVVPAAGGKQKRPANSGAPSPVPGGNISRTSSNAQISRSNSTSNNLGAQDRRGPRAPAPTAAAPPRKDKPPAKDAARQARGPRGGSASPVPGDKDGEADAAKESAAGIATEEAASPAEPVSYGTDLAEIQKRVRSAMKEFYANGLLEEPKLTFQELRPSPELMADVVKDMISQAVETSSEKSCSALCSLLDALRTLQVPGLPSAAPLLAAEDVKEAVYRFLHSFDDVLIDAPKAGTLGAVIVATLCAKGILALDLFGSLPEVNEFSYSTKFVEFVLQVVAALSEVSGPERAEAALRAAQLDLLGKVFAPPKEEPADVLKALAAKFGISFAI